MNVTICVCGHVIEDHEGEYGVCQEYDCFCVMFEADPHLAPSSPPAHLLYASSLDVGVVSAVIGLAPSKWAGQSYATAVALVRHGLIKGTVRYGYWLGPVAPESPFFGRPIISHGWVDLGDDHVCDPTRWVFEAVDPYIYEGPNDHYDFGGNYLRALIGNPTA
ncbi:MAG: hypothetical protein GY803_22360 [Chloroflexi bacterium]|nr:hypothetical protein [Chloroflexota bacterium]